MTAQPGFWMTVTDAGGGMVTGVVRRDTSSYPFEGDDVFVSGSGEHDPDIDRPMVTVRHEDLLLVLNNHPLGGRAAQARQEAQARLKAAADALSGTAPRERR